MYSSVKSIKNVTGLGRHGTPNTRSQKSMGGMVIISYDSSSNNHHLSINPSEEQSSISSSYFYWQNDINLKKKHHLEGIKELTGMGKQREVCVVKQNTFCTHIKILQ